MENPPSIRHSELSFVYSLDDDPWRPSHRINCLLAELAACCPNSTHPILEQRQSIGTQWFRHYPGECYNLVTALVEILHPINVWEFGTGNGMSTVAILESLCKTSSLFTIDTDSWSSKHDTWLIESDFSSHRLTQLIVNNFSQDLNSSFCKFSKADLIFLNGQITEKSFEDIIDFLSKQTFEGSPIVVIDNIRLARFAPLWRALPHPKIDVTTFGHWAGTGLLEWFPRNVLLPREPEFVSNHNSETATHRAVTTKRILMLCHHYPNYVPDLLLHGLRKIMGLNIIDYPRKNSLYTGHLGQPFLDPVPDLMLPDGDVDRTDIQEKAKLGYFDLVICDYRAINEQCDILESCKSAVVFVDGEDMPVSIKSNKAIVLRRETDGTDYSIPLQMGMPIEVINWIDRYKCVEKTNSIAFMGSRNPKMDDRNFLLDELLRIFPDSLISSWQLGSEANWSGRDNYYRCLQSCKIVLTLPGAGYDTFRFWENTACNAVHISKRMPLFVPNDFRSGIEILRFNNIRELVYLADRILSGEDHAQEYSEKSRHWLTAFHTTERKAEHTLDKIWKALGK